MVNLSVETKKLIYDGLSSVMNLNACDWSILNNEIKIKILHNIIGFFLFNTFFVDSCLNIPIKSIKPKKLIMFCNFNKKNNTSILNIYNKSILDYTNDFRNNFINIKNKIYYTFDNMPIDIYNKIIEGYIIIIFNTIYNNLKLIDIDYLYNNLLNNNINKVISNEKLTLSIIMNNNELILYFNNNITINLSLIINKNKITNNLPVFFKINLINKF